ncbi:cyclic nucleotide-binding domain-containing protein [Bradyrhizobium sp.]|uniref:Crp/Fnr family transcriptional regulator n=1 Tax=Bradyrhizobium sp. TaxID=376 RepID=UPI00260C4EB5|nr:cyclic nucleotide-binding domain-containing protein [Bradyrhizobium sp.]
MKRLATHVRFDGGHRILSEGDRNAFGLSYGEVRLYKLLPDRRRQVVAFALPGDFLAMPLADHFSISADAIGEVSVCRFPREELKRFVQSSPNIWRLLTGLEQTTLVTRRTGRVLGVCAALLPVVLPAVFSVGSRADESIVPVAARGGIEAKLEYCKTCHGLAGQGYRGWLPMPRLAG